MLTQEAIKLYLDKTVEAIKADAQAKGQAIPDGFRVEVTEEGGKLYAADYFKYLVLGRGPGKAPPPDKLLDWVSKQPETSGWREIEKKSLAYVIGQKIAKQGTDIFTGKRPGIDFLGSMEMNMPDLLKVIARNEALKVLTVFKSEINVPVGSI